MARGGGTVSTRRDVIASRWKQKTREGGERLETDAYFSVRYPRYLSSYFCLFLIHNSHFGKKNRGNINNKNIYIFFLK